jgi:phosphate transport system protein
MSMGITTDLERIADLSVDICQRVLELADKPLLKPLVDIPKLTTMACEMVRDAVDAFVSGDAQLATRVIRRDREADDLRNRIVDELTNDYMSKDPQSVPRALPLLLIARHLERICDHATNVAEEVIYMVQAKMVRHHPENLQ